MHAVAKLLVAEERGYLDGLQEKDEGCFDRRAQACVHRERQRVGA